MKKAVVDISKSQQALRAVLEKACNLYEEGKKSRSIALFKRAAAGGVVEAQVNLGNIYDDGEGVRSNFEMARYWYRRAVRQGSAEGAYNLGVSYLHRNNQRWARHWFLVAKSMGDEDAQEMLDSMR